MSGWPFRRATRRRWSMAALTKVADQPANTRRYLYGAFGVVALLSVAILIYKLQRPPQMGADEEVFKTVDALFTAVTARNEKLLSECEQRLKKHKEAGNLPPQAAARLDS